MPTLTLGTARPAERAQSGRDPTAGPTAGTPRAGAATGAAPMSGDWPGGTGSVGAHTRTTSRPGTRTTGTLRHRRAGRAGQTGTRTERRESRAGGQGSPPGESARGPGTADDYPDLALKRPAPRVDATHGDATRGDATRPDEPGGPADAGPTERERADDVADEAARAIQEAFFGRGSGLSAHDSAVDRVVDRLYREVERKMRIERERRGL